MARWLFRGAIQRLMWLKFLSVIYNICHANGNLNTSPSLIFLNLLSSVLQLSFVVMLLWLFIKARRLKRYQNELVTALQTSGNGRWFRINLSRPAHFATLFKILGFEAKGLLIDAPDSIRVMAQLASGEKIDRSYAKDALDLQWLGNKKLASANIHWISVGAAEQKLMLSADTGFNAITSRETLADICRNIQPQLPLPDAAKADFALEKNRASLGFIVAFFALIAFALVDGIVVNPYSLVSAGKAMWGTALLALIPIPGYFFLSKKNVPSRESLTLSMLLLVALLLAYIPAIMRIDELLTPQGAQSYDYTLQLPASLLPVDTVPPALEFVRLKEYWAQFEEKSVHKFSLLHGPLGLWQADYSALDEATRQFYDLKTRPHQK